MKALFFLSILTGMASAYQLPNGTWNGGGHYKMLSGETGNYTETLTVNNNVMTNALTMGTQKITYTMTFAFTTSDFAKVTFNDDVMHQTIEGTGYCGSVWCHIEEPNKMEMTIVFDGKSVYELGSDKVDQGYGWFESALNQ